MAVTKKATEVELTDTEKEADEQAAASRIEAETGETTPEETTPEEPTPEESAPEEPSLNDEFNRLAAKIMLTVQDTPVRETILNKLTQLQMLTQAIQPI